MRRRLELVAKAAVAGCEDEVTVDFAIATSPGKVQFAATSQSARCSFCSCVGTGENMVK